MKQENDQPFQLSKTLRLKTGEEAEFVERLNSREVENYGGRQKRRHQRFHMRHDVVAMLELQGLNVPESRYLVRCRNLSRGGLGFLHGSYVHPQTTGRVTLIAPDRTAMRMQGKVVCCRLLEGSTHEIGFAFNEPFQKDDDLSMYAESSAEDGDERQLMGRCLIVNKSEAVRGLMSTSLTKLGAEVFTASTREQVKAICSTMEITALIIDRHLEGEPTDDLIRQADGLSPRPFILAHGFSNDENLSDDSPAGQADCILHGSPTVDALYDNLKDHLNNPEMACSTQPNLSLRSSRWHDKNIRPMVRSFTSEAIAHIHTLDRMMLTDQGDSQKNGQVEVILQDLQHNAKLFGMRELADLAEQVSRAFSRKDSATLQTQLMRLISVIKQSWIIHCKSAA